MTMPHPINCVADRRPKLIVGHNERQGGWCVFEQTSYAEYCFRRGPFPSKDLAISALADMKNDVTPNEQ
jgi:hypothetical protein